MWDPPRYQYSTLQCTITMYSKNIVRGQNFLGPTRVRKKENIILRPYEGGGVAYTVCHMGSNLGTQVVRVRLEVCGIEAVWLARCKAAIRPVFGGIW